MRRYGIYHPLFAGLCATAITLATLFDCPHPMFGAEPVAAEKTTFKGKNRETPSDDTPAIVLSTGESCDVTFDRLEYLGKEKTLPQITLGFYKGMSQLKPKQHFTYEAFSNTINEKPFAVGGAPTASITLSSTSTANAWQDRQGVVRVTVVSGTMSFSKIDVTIYTGEEVYGANVCVSGKRKITKGVPVDKVKVPKELLLSPKWRGIKQEFPPHSFIGKQETVECACDICRRTSGILVLDQAQPIYNGGTSARALSGYSVWQSFTPSQNGSLERLDIGFFGDMSGHGRLAIYSGEGVSGKALYSATVPVVAGENTGIWNSYFMKVPVLANKKYTFQFTPDPSKMPDPYGLCVGSYATSSKGLKAVGERTVKTTYTRGTFALIDPSGETRQTDMHTVFRSYVNPDKK